MARDGPVTVGRMVRARLVGSLLVVLVCASVSATPAPRIDVSVGFSGHFVPGQVAPLRVRIFGVDSAFVGSLQVIEEVGNAWRGQARTSLCLPVDGGSASYEETIPIYDFSHPLLVLLLDEEQHVIAQQEVALRDNWRSEPFVLLAGSFPTQIVPDAVQISETDLPTKWLSYGGVESVWLGRTSYHMTTDQEEAIYRWTSAGGTIVIFTGSDFFRIDSPLIREVAPVADPHLDDGKILLGRLRIEADVLLRDSAGSPLVISRKFGAGEVLFVTMDAFSLSVAQYEKLLGLVPGAQILDLSDVTASLLGRMPLTRPGFPTAIGIVTVMLLSLVVITSRVHQRGMRIILLLGAAGACSLWSGFYVNNTKRTCDIYSVNTQVSVQTILGYTIDGYGITYLGGADPGEALVRADGAVLQELPRDLNGGAYDIDLRCDRNSLISISPGEVRILRGGTSDESSISIFQRGESRVEIDNGLGVSLPYAALISDGRSFLLGPISPGVHTYSLTRKASVIMPTSAELAMLYGVVSGVYDVSIGTWLVGGLISDSIVERGGYRQKVRVVKLFLVEGEKR